jgi:hypothetical protein
VVPAEDTGEPGLPACAAVVVERRYDGSLVGGVMRSTLNTRLVDLRTALGRIRCSARLRGTIAACLRKVNEIDVFTGGKYDFVLSNKEHGENVRG